MKVRVKFTLIAIAVLSAPVWASDAQPKQAGRWPQEYGGRKPDPAVTFGSLPNGLRFAIMRNDSSSDGIAMRLRIGAGSMDESDGQQGFAHFIEHMAFRGSKNVPDGEVVRVLERQGLRFGHDTNAFTTQDQTVYVFNFPKADRWALETGLSLFREIGERLTFSPASVEAEKGVVLSEERIRDVPVYRMFKANLDNLLAGTRAAERWPIGSIETLKAATPGQLRDYYVHKYRPGNATLIVVGNINPAEVKSKIETLFSDWKAGSFKRRAPRRALNPAKPAIEFVAPGAPDVFALSWVRAVDGRANTEAWWREQLIQQIGLVVFNNRLTDRAARLGSPLVGGRAVVTPDLFGTAAITQIEIAAAPEQWGEALDAVVEEQRQIISGSIKDSELKRAVNEILSNIQGVSRNYGRKTNEEIANSLILSINQGGSFTNSEQDLEFTKKILSKLRDDEVLRGVKTIFSGKGPILFRSTQANPVGVPVLQARLTASYDRPLGRRTDEASIVWPYYKFGAWGSVVSQIRDTDTGATVVTFANGTRLMIKPTQFEKGGIRIKVSVGQGRAGAPADLIHALWAAEFMPLGGTGKLGVTELQRWAQSSGKLVGAAFEPDNLSFQIAGITRPADLVSELQLLAAYVRDPGFRPELGEKLAVIGPMLAGQLNAHADIVFQRERNRIFGGGDSRYNKFTTDADTVATKFADLPAMLKPAFMGSADITVVGDVEVLAVIAAVQVTFGAGPDLARPPVADSRLIMPAGRDEPYVVTHTGRNDQAVYGVFWGLSDYFADPRRSDVADVVSGILQARMNDTVRERLGISYSPTVAAFASVQVSGVGYFGASLPTQPSNFLTFRTILEDQLQSLSRTPVSADELARAVRPLIEHEAKLRETNAWWLDNLATLWREPRARAVFLRQPERFSTVTAADVQAFAAKTLVATKPVVIIAKAK